MSSLEKVYGITEQLFQLVTRPLITEERDDLVSQINQLISTREQFISGVQPPFGPKDMQMYEQLMIWNETINEKFAFIKSQIQQDMTQLKKSKATNQQYVNPYQNVSSSDGMFYDKRK
ncbi:hypothetical protein [Metabacillus endolithicus]|uniref:Flagellar protein FliT n=1 Tax=Metabacillus endolithicus TaxID=1535204 RepID=A0ABW5BXN6_9BACI|nr:hypothetical protein [Metabacillus endolithicus]UPG65360.1 hypothetical protein MVE64_10530 [Metabacillus endolithicus]